MAIEEKLKVCVWSRNTGNGYDKGKTTCGRLTVVDGNVGKNRYGWCPYCGRDISIALGKTNEGDIVRLSDDYGRGGQSEKIESKA
jgi:hypothetical protein